MATVAPAPPKATFRRRRAFVLLLAVLVLLVAAAPTIVSYAPQRNWLLSAAVPDLEGSLEANDASFGWLSSQSLEGLSARAGDSPLFSVASIRLDRSLLGLVFDSSDLGTLSIARPHVQLLFDEQGSNFSRAFARSGSRPKDPDAIPLRGKSVQVAVTDAAVSWQLKRESPLWSIDRLDFSVTVEPDEAGNPQLVLDAGQLLDRYKLTEGMCTDVLKYPAWILQTAPPRVEGQISVRINRCEVPLADPKRAEIAGELTLHSVDVGGGPIVKVVAAVLGVPPSVKLADEATIQFAVSNGLVAHDGLEFGLGPLRVRTRGTVALADESLDIAAEVFINTPVSELSDRPLLRALATQPLRLPIRGTLNQPVVDGQEAAASGLQTLAQLLRNFQRGEPEVPLNETIIGQLIDLLGENGKVDGAAAAGAASDAARQLMEQLRERRRARAEKADKPAPREPAEPGAAEEKPRRPLRDLLNRMRTSEEPK